MNWFSSWNHSWEGENNRRMMQRSPDGLDIEEIARLTQWITFRTQAITGTVTGKTISKEFLILWSESEIEAYLSDVEIAFQIFLAQLVKAFHSPAHWHINLELDVLKRIDFQSRIHPIVSQYKRKDDRKWVSIEITERGKPIDVFENTTTENLRYLKRLWFRLLIDDYWSTVVSRLLLQRYRDIFAWVKIPHELKNTLFERDPTVLRMVPPSMYIIAEGSWLIQRRSFLPSRVRWIQDPAYNWLENS